MDFRVKKLILEEGMKNIAETEGVKLEMSFDSFTKKVEVEFDFNATCGIGGVRKTCSYDDISRMDTDVFKTIEDTRREVRDLKASNPTAIGFMNGMRRGFTYHPVDKNAIDRMKEVLNAEYGYFSKTSKIPKIKNVIFNYPATIVFWADGDKTVVKCQNDDVFDAEKGLAMAIIKKMNGGKGNYCEIFKPWMGKYEEEKNTILERIAEKWPTGHEYIIPKKDLEDILEGNVDPMMIKTDEENEEMSEPLKDVVATFKSSVSTFHSCHDCKHGDLGLNDKPCDECIKECKPGNSTPKWEPKE